MLFIFVLLLRPTEIYTSGLYHSIINSLCYWESVAVANILRLMHARQYIKYHSWSQLIHAETSVAI